MTSNDEHQNLEIQALKSIYNDLFFESSPPKAWKGAARLPEFNIRILHPLSNSIYAVLNVKFPKSYPSKSPPILAISDYKGPTAAQMNKIMDLIHSEAQKHVGEETIFSIILSMEEWLKTNISAPKEPSGLSLAIEMQNRALEQEKATKEREASLAKAADELEARRAKELMEQIEQGKEEMQRLAKERYRSRQRVLSNSTEVPAFGMSIQTFDEEIHACGYRFKSVRLFHGRKDCLSTVYDAEPLLDESVDSVALEMHVISFESNYYKTQQGRKKIDQVLNELQRMTAIADDLVQKVYVARLDISKTNVSRLSILMEKRPALTLDRVLRECDGFREDRVSQYLSQICSGLSKVYEIGLVHRAMTPASIGLVDIADGGKTVKLLRTAVQTRLHDLHRSEPFGSDVYFDVSDLVLPDNWLWYEAIESPLLYTRGRDMHGVGIIALQMLMGLDVIQRYPSPGAAMQDCDFSPGLTQIIADCLRLRKKSSIPDAVDILGRLARESLRLSSKTMPITIRTKSSSTSGVKTPLARSLASVSSSDTSFLMGPQNRTRRASRWREDWDELDTLGKGGFGSVVKARNRLDNRVYAVKRIKLRTSQSDNKIFREVNALSRLSHRFIVRYYTTWLEETESMSSNLSSDSEPDDFGSLGDKTAGGASQMTRTISTDTDSFQDLRIFNLNDLVLEDYSQNTRSFPSIHFTSGDVTSDGSDEEDVSSVRMAERMQRKKVDKQIAQRFTERTLYIQMEYVENQTLKERIGEGISEDDAWRLFQQIVDALVHMASLGILHRDIKLTNIFIDSNGDCKVGDFGLATSSLASVDPSDVSPVQMAVTPDITLDIGTHLYIAPEILSKRGGSRSKDHSKADLYSLGIVFFEMNYTFSTMSERVSVIENLRLPDICFPADWDTKRTSQREIIQSLLQHDPDKRPTALQLSQSPMLPSRVEDEYFKESLHAMTNSKNRYYPAIVSSLFQQEPNPVREHIYDEDLPESSTLRHVVVERLEHLFHLHGARHVDIPLLMPLNKVHREDLWQVLLIDTHGEVVTLPSTGLVPFARLAARTGVTRIKRYNIMDIYRGGNLLGHPHVSTAAILDIITPDTVQGTQVASAEMLVLMDECLSVFPYLKSYQVHVSHSKISEIVMTRIPEKLRSTVVEILQMKTSFSQKRLSLQKKNLSKVITDDLEWLCEDYEDIIVPLMRMEKTSPSLVESVAPLLQDVGRVISLAISSGLSCSVRVKPLMVGRRHDPFKDGVCFEIIGGEKRSGILAVGGRYDHLIRQFAPPSSRDYQQYVKREPFVAVGLQIALERITTAIASFQCDFLNNSNNQRVYDYWSARRCDVYIISFQPGQLSIRLEIAALLWKHGISSDLMYETGVSDTNMEELADLCYSEGVLFTLYPKIKFGQREVIEFKVKSVLRGTEYEVSRSELIPWLQQHIAEQKRLDLTSSGVAGPSVDVISAAIPGIKESHSDHDVQLVLPGEGVSVKKHRKTTRQLFFERAYEKCMRLKSAVQSGSLPMLAVDVPPAMFDALVRSDHWVTDDDAWRTFTSNFPHQYAGYANQIRDAVLRRKNEGMDLMVLFAVKEERMGLLNLKGGLSEH